MQADQAFDIYRTVSNWLVPVVLAFSLRFLSQIAKRLSEISESLAVVVNQIDSHEKRIAKLEDRFLART